MVAKLDQKMEGLKISEPMVTAVRFCYKYDVDYSIPLRDCEARVGVVDLARFTVSEDKTRCCVLGDSTDTVADITLQVNLIRFIPASKEFTLGMYLSRHSRSSCDVITLSSDHPINSGFAIHEGKFLLLSVDDVVTGIENECLAINCCVSAFQ